jgi:hypothetical protein
MAGLYSLLLFALGFCSLLRDGIAQKSICVGDEHANGSWRLRNNSMELIQKSFHCCGYDEKAFEHDTKICSGPLKPDHDILVHGSKKFVLDMVGGSACVVCDQKEGMFSVNTREKYIWQPHNCHLLPWNSWEFCGLLGNRTISFMGDSISAQSASTLVNLIIAGGGICASQISYLTTYQGKVASHAKKFLFRVGIKPDFLVLSAGAHEHSIADFNKVWEDMREVIPVLRLKNPHTHFIWKTQNPGHPVCWEAKKPVTYYNYSSSLSDSYNWSSFLNYDRISRLQSKELNMTLIDMSPLYLRPDSHPHHDCLHFCLPGPVDIIGNIMLTKLRMKEM